MWYVGGHDRRLTENMKLVDVTVPYGVVVADSYSYEDVEESSGAIVTYLTCEVVLWTGRYKDLMNAAYDDEIYFGQSMEIIPRVTCKYAQDENYTEIQKFDFSCLTLLGKSDDPDYHTEPCFPEAKVVPFSSVPEFKAMFEEMQRQIAEISESYRTLVETYSISAQEKEERILNEKLEFLKTLGFTVEELDFSIDEMSIEDLKEKLANYQVQSVGDPAEEGDPQPEGEGKYALNMGDYLREVSNLVSEEKVVSDYGWTYSRYWLVDVQDNEAIVQDSMEHYNYYGFPIIEDGDNLSIDFANKTRKKQKFESFEGAEPTIVFQNESVMDAIESKVAEYVAARDQAEADLSAAREEIATLKTEFEAATEKVAQYEAQIQQAAEEAAAAARNEVFERFENELSGVEAFEAMKDSALSAEDVEKECFMLVGKKKFKPIPAKSNETAKFSFVSDHETDPYNGLFEKFKKN